MRKLVIKWIDDLFLSRIAELLKYGFWGVVATAFNLILFYLMIKIGIHYVVTNLVSYFLAVLLSYYLNNAYVFQEKSQQKELWKIVKFTLIRVGAICADTFILVILKDYLEMDLMLSRIVLSIFIIMVTYVLNVVFVFKVKRGHERSC